MTDSGANLGGVVSSWQVEKLKGDQGKKNGYIGFLLLLLLFLITILVCQNGP